MREMSKTHPKPDSQVERPPPDPNGKGATNTATTTITVRNHVAGRMFLIVVMLILGVGGMMALGHANTESIPETTVTNETWTPAAGSYVSLNNSKLNDTAYSDTVTVYDENDTEMSEGTDYEWNDSFEEGRIQAVAGGGLDGDANATVTYGYREPSGEHVAVGETVQTIGPLARLVMIGTIVAAMVIAGGRMAS